MPADPVTNPKILWAAPNALLDTTNGAALAVRAILKQLALRDCEVRILGGTNFVNPNGMTYFREVMPQLEKQQGKFLTCGDGPLQHRLLVTRTTRRRLMHSFEEQIWFDEYCRMLDEFRPDIVMFFDNSLITLLTCDEARRRGIPAAVYLAHPNNTGQRWCRDVSLMLTDSRATANMYKEREGYDIATVGAFIDPADYLAEQHTRENLLFVTPTIEKGAAFVIQLALQLEQARPDIRFEVVETRSNWNEVLRSVTRSLGQERESLSNVTVTTNVRDMRPVYGRARAVIVPSVWWESAARVVIEGQLNGIPVLGSDSGGIPEMIGSGGRVLEFSKADGEQLRQGRFPAGLLDQARQWIERLYDDAEFHDSAVERAYAAYREQHDINRNTDRVMEALTGCIAAAYRKAGGA
ncbi:MAG: glycosyltransferase [Novosphingobium sp.]|nr:glycosyltransferase [Novosphingobium sp.]MCP5403153.1 glycosyltransferase [Novosphingobium sp.]